MIYNYNFKMDNKSSQKKLENTQSELLDGKYNYIRGKMHSFTAEGIK